MAELNAARRKKLPAGKFAIPPKNGAPGIYPIDTKARAVSALARAKANATPAEQAQVRAAVKAAYPNLPSSQGAGRSAAAKANRKAAGSTTKGGGTRKPMNLRGK